MAAATDKGTLRKMITEILDGADLQTITAKKVRQQLEEKLSSDLTDRKKEIDQIVMEVLDEKNEEKSDAAPSEESEEERKPARRSTGGGASKRKARNDDSDEDGDDNYSPKGKKAKGKKKGSSDDDDSDGDWKSKTRTRKAAPKKKAAASGETKKKAGGGGGRGYTKTCKLSPALASLMGEENMARHEVVKRMWAIIKEKNLYDPKNKQFAICNEELAPVFGVKRFRTFGMMKLLKKHFTD